MNQFFPRTGVEAGLDRRWDEFLATFAHELRNPLAPIRHSLKLLDTIGLDEAKRQWSSQVNARQVQRMTLILDDLLDVSRITRGRLELKRASVDLTALIATTVETATPLIEAKAHVNSRSAPRTGHRRD